jgi:hypothetical protein
MQHGVKTLATDFFDEGTQKLDARYDKCLNLFGVYVEKYLKARKLVKIKTFKMLSFYPFTANRNLLTGHES